jgi:anti-anti-sigma factor
MAAQATADMVTQTFGFVCVRAIGEIDAHTAPLFERMLSPGSGPPPATLVVDLHGVTFLGVAGLVILAKAMDLAHHNGTRLCIHSSTVAVDRALSLLDRVPDVHERRLSQRTLGCRSSRQSSRSKT